MGHKTLKSVLNGRHLCKVQKSTFRFFWKISSGLSDPKTLRKVTKNYHFLSLPRRPNRRRLRRRHTLPCNLLTNSKKPAIRPLFGLIRPKSAAESGGLTMQRLMPWARWRYDAKYVNFCIFCGGKSGRSLTKKKYPVPSPNVRKRRLARMRAGNFLTGDS